MDKKTKVDVFSGFLGAGKTTLIRKLIEETYSNEKLVLIENEFGEIGIDKGFLKDAGITINEMNSGCICCTLVGDFSKSIEKVLDEFTPDRILIEPSGVGKLSDIVLAVENLEDERILLNGFTTVVDAQKCKMYMKNFGEFYNNQVEHASCIILSHTDGMTGETIDEVVELLREKNAHATIITTDWNKLTGEQILNSMEQKDTLKQAMEHLEHEVEMAKAHQHAHEHHHHDECCGEHEHHHHDECCGEHEHHHHDECCGEHEHHHHDECCGEHEHHHHDECCGEHEQHHHHNHTADQVFDSIGLESSRVYAKDELEGMLKELDSNSEVGVILRAKGIVAGTDSWLHFDLVPGNIEIRQGSAEITGRIVVIGTAVNGDKVKEIFHIK